MIRKLGTDLVQSRKTSLGQIIEAEDLDGRRMGGKDLVSLMGAFLSLHSLVSSF